MNIFYSFFFPFFSLIINHLFSLSTNLKNTFALVLVSPTPQYTVRLVKLQVLWQHNPCLQAMPGCPWNLSEAWIICIKIGWHSGPLSQFFVTVANIFIPKSVAPFFIIAQESILPLPHKMLHKHYWHFTWQQRGSTSISNVHAANLPTPTPCCLS